MTDATVTGTVIAAPSSNCRFSSLRRVSQKPGAAAMAQPGGCLHLPNDV
jgi:hypothetical protein